jgi:hypothetical protein
MIAITAMIALIVSLVCQLVLRPGWQREARLLGSEIRDSHAVSLPQTTGSLVVVKDDQEPVLIGVDQNTRVYFIPAQ